jgi:hypothetical protein
VQDNYSYLNAGFDDFLSRSIDNTQRTNLDSPGPVSSQVRYDAAQVSGFLGDTIQIGGVRITRKGIIMNDGNNDVLLIGDDV